MIKAHPFTLVVYSPVMRVLSVAKKEGKEIRRGVGFIFVFIQQHLHLLLPSHRKALPGLASRVTEIAFLEVGLVKMGKVDEGDATQIEAHKECVSCQLFLEGEVFSRIHTLYPAHAFRRDGSLGGLGNAGIDITEGTVLRSDAFSHGFVVDSTKDAQIERTGVAAYPYLIM